MRRKVINFAAFQVGWFACILSAGWGWPWIGVTYVVAWAAVHVWHSDRRGAELRLLGLAGVLGYVADSTLVLIGLLSFADHAVLGWPSTLWMAAMWVNFATTLNVSLGWLRGRYAAGALLGLIGGPMAYYGGMTLNAVQLAEPLWRSLLAVGIEWMIATPLLLAMLELASRMRPSLADAGTESHEVAS